MIEINPPWLTAAQYIAFLNCGFPRQWDQRAYDWYIARPFNDWKSDVIVQAEDSRVLAGMALSYRQVRIDTSIIDVCVISAAVTLPAERCRGHYAAVLNAALRRAGGRGSAAVLGFVTRTNVSGRGLSRLGAHAVPSYYITSSGTPWRRARSSGTRPRTIRARHGESDSLAALARCAEAHVPRSRMAQFHYGQSADWRRQFVERPNGVHAVRLAHDSVALVEAVGTTDRLQWLASPRARTSECIAALAQRSAQASRAFFMYSLDSREAAAARGIGLKILGGYFMLLSTGPSREWTQLAGSPWRIQSGDRL